MLLIPILLGAMFILPMVSAGASTWFNMTLTDFANVTTGTNNVTTTVAVAADYNVTNVTCYYNSSGGAQYPNQNTTFFGTTVNSSALDSSFTITGTISTDSNNLNMTCVLANDSDSAGVLPLAGGNSTVSARAIKVDGTLPVLTLSLDSANIGVRDPLLVKWTIVDSGSKIQYYYINTTTPDNAKCPKIQSAAGVSGSDTTTTSQDSLNGEQTACAGTYTVNLTAIDYSGNLASTKKTFAASMAGLTKGGSNTLGGSDVSGFSQGSEINSNLPLGETGTNVAIIVVIGAALYLFFRKK